MEKTSWDSYYKNESTITKFTRKYVQLNIINFLNKHYREKKPSIMELGGANSCFYEAINDAIKPSLYSILDNNEFGISLFADKFKNSQRIKTYMQDVINTRMDVRFDIVFSVGLIEHFHNKDVLKVIKSHFDMVREGGIVLVSFPTPTVQYKIVRGTIDILGKWIFYDEIPIKPSEVEPILNYYGVILDKKLLRKLPLTQYMYVVRKQKKETE